MSKTAAISKLLADALENGTLGGCDLRMIARTLEAVPEEYHEDAVRAALGADKDEDEAPEDYAVVRTYESPILGIGDEIITSGGTNAVVISIGNTYMSVLHADQTIEMLPVSAGIRTGRNFPAIAEILDKIRK